MRGMAAPTLVATMAQQPNLPDWLTWLLGAGGAGGLVGALAKLVDMRARAARRTVTTERLSAAAQFYADAMHEIGDLRAEGARLRAELETQRQARAAGEAALYTDLTATQRQVEAGGEERRQLALTLINTQQQILQLRSDSSAQAARIYQWEQWLTQLAQIATARYPQEWALLLAAAPPPVGISEMISPKGEPP